MPGPTPKQTPFTIAELLEFWRAAIVDPTYSNPLLQRLVARLDDGADIDLGTDPPPGDQQEGYEAFTQAMAQVKRASEAIVRTLEAMFILPWSGQVDEPAAGAARALVLLTFERKSAFEQVITLAEGQTWVQEIQTDATEDGGITVETERRYALLDRVVFLPGEVGPKLAWAVAEKVGYGYNNPQPGTISAIIQKGAGLQNDGASVVPGTDTHQLVVTPEPDVVVPEHAGQFVRFIGGVNQGRLVRVVGYQSPSGVNGGIAYLARTVVAKVSAIVGSFVQDEVVTQATTLATAKVSAIGAGYVVLEAANDLWAAGFTMTGAQSGATALMGIIEAPAALTAETGTATWLVVPWADLGVVVTNTQQPAGGKHDMLDELGRERRIARGPGESDDLYRQRIAALPDTISPAAILRAANRILAPLGLSAVLREAGAATLPGFFADRDATDYNPALNPADKWKVLLSYTCFRGWFMVGVPPLALGETGYAFDVGPYGAYDADPFLAFYDGIPLTAAVVYSAIWSAINAARAGGVGFELYQEAAI